MTWREVLVHFPANCRTDAAEVRGTGTGFSGAMFWRINAPRGELCLRRWPPEHPSPQRLQFIHDVLRHVAAQGFRLLPVPITTRAGETFVAHEDCLWELSPWLSGCADFRQRPSQVRLVSAMEALAAFHVAAATFPLSQPCEGISPGVVQRHVHLSRLVAGDMAELLAEAQRKQSLWPELAARSHRLGELFVLRADDVWRLLAAARLVVPIQASIRDIWHDHVLFQGDEVSGIVDFGAMRPENVAGDVARLAGSLVEDDADGWRAGVAAYETIRPLSPDERSLLRVFDESSVLLGGVKWMEWVFREERQFADRAAVLTHVDGILRRLERRTTNRSSSAIKLIGSDRALT